MCEGSPSGGRFQMASKIEARGVAPSVAPRCPSSILNLSYDKNRIHGSAAKIGCVEKPIAKTAPSTSGRHIFCRGARRGGAWVAGCRFPPPSCGRFQVSGSRKRAPEVSGCGPQLPSAPGRRGFREELRDAPCSRLSIVRFDTGPKGSMGHLLGGEKNNFFNSRY